MKTLIAFLFLFTVAHAEPSVESMIESDTINPEAHHYFESNTTMLCYMYDDKKGGYCAKPVYIEDLYFCLFNDEGVLIECWEQFENI